MPTYILYLLLLFSVSSETAKNIFTNYFGKNHFKSDSDSFLFNVVSGIGATLFFVVVTGNFEISSYSFRMAVIFALLSAGANYFTLMAMAKGPMAVASLVVYVGGMVPPIIFGVFCYHQAVKITQIIGFVLMIVSLVLCVNLKKDKRMSVKWLFYAVTSFLCWGFIGVCQQIHQESKYAYELNEFMLWSFIIMTILFAALYLCVKNKDRQISTYAFKSKTSFLVIGVGVLIGIVYMLNLYLVGVLPAIVMFPAGNGGVTLLSALSAIIFFKEKTDAKQITGIVIGIISICLLGI